MNKATPTPPSATSEAPTGVFFAGWQGDEESIPGVAVEIHAHRSRFTSGRYHPILKKVRAHYGIDYAAPGNAGTVDRKGPRHLGQVAGGAEG
jgi:murein DD-endopeptidase MepM/ murein hydrolase activator NlpD